MIMTDSEIVRHYNQSADKAKDIKILADLNATNTAAIRDVLRNAGVILDDRLKPALTGKALTAAIEARIIKGLSDGQIASEIGCSPQTVYRRRKAMRESDAAPPSPQGQPRSEGSILDLIDAITALLPPGASKATREAAEDLCLALCADYIANRLGLEVPND